MKVTRISIRNILGVEALDFEPGALTILAGRNGVGKTSILAAISGALRGGHDPSLLRQGAEKGQIDILLEDGTAIVKRIFPGKSVLDVTAPELGKISRAQTWLDGQFDELGVNALSLVTCPASKCAEYVAEIMPIRVDSDDLEPIIGRTLTEKDLDGNALDLIAAERQKLYDKRTGENRLGKDKRTTAAQLRETLPPAGEVPEDPAALREEFSSVSADRTAEIQNAKTKCEHDLREAEAELRKGEREAAKVEDDAVAQIRLEMEKWIEEVRAAGRKRAGKVNAAYRVSLDLAHSTEEEALGAVAAKFKAPLADLTEKISKAETRREGWARAEKTREILAKSEKEAAGHEAQAAALSHAIDELDALRTRLLETLPIKGLEIRGGEVFVDGITWPRVNKRRRFDIALEIACLRAGKVGLVVLDDVEAIDPESFPEWEKAAAARGLQVVVAKVTGGDLNVRTVDAATAADA